MRKQVNSKGREDSVASRWADLMQYEKEMEVMPQSKEHVKETICTRNLESYGIEP